MAQRRLFSDIIITIDTTLEEGNLTALLYCFSTTRLATHVQSVTIVADGWRPGYSQESVNIPELQKVLALVANSHRDEMVNGELVRQESRVTSLYLDGLRGTEEQIHDIATIFPHLRTLEFWDVDLNYTTDGDQVAFREIEGVPTLRSALTWFCCRSNSFKIPLQRLFPENLAVNLRYISFELATDGMKQQWDDLIKRAGASLHTIDVNFGEVDYPIHASRRTFMIRRTCRSAFLPEFAFFRTVDLTFNTRLRAINLRNLYIAEATAEWLTSSLASIQPEYLEELRLYCCTYDTEESRAPGATALALSMVDQAIAELKESKRGSLHRVVIHNVMVRGEGEGLTYHDWASRCFPRTFQAGLLELEGELIHWPGQNVPEAADSWERGVVSGTRHARDRPKH